MKIGSRLTLSFVAVGLLMATGSVVAFWQFHRLQSEAQRLYLVDTKAQTVMRVHTNVLTFHQNLDRLLETQDIARFEKEAAPRRQEFQADVERAIQALGNSPLGADRHPAALQTLQSIHLELPAQIDAVLELARAGEWSAVRRRLDTQVKNLGRGTAALVEDIDRDVSREQKEALENIRRVQREAVWTLVGTGLLTLLTGAFLGTMVTRSITRPLSRLDAGAQALARGEFQHQVLLPGRDELASLGGVFNQTAARLQDVYGALRRSEQQFRSLIEHASDLIMVLSPSGLLTYVSPSCQRVLGYPAESVVGRDVFELAPGSAADKLRTVMKEAVAAPGVGREVELELRHADGSVRVLEAIATNLLHDPAVAGVVVNGRDVTERNRAALAEVALRTALKKAAAEWELTFDSIESPMLILDAQGLVRRLNRATRELAGVAGYHELVGRPVREFGPGQPWQKAGEVAAQIAERGRPVHAQVHDAASGRTWDITAGPTAGPTGEAERVIVVARDATRMIELQESLRRSETMSAMGALVAGVAHEVRNPLFSISANLDAFEAQYGHRPEYREAITLLRAETTRLAALMNDLLDYGRPACETPSPEPIDEVIAQAVGACTSLARQREVNVQARVPSGLPPVVMDRHRIAQVLQNLLENAIQHSPRGADVWIEAQATLAGERPWVACSVSDAGPGFSEEDLPRLFEPFFTRRRGGTGLGLSIVQRIVELHGGNIAAANRPEGGAVMTVRLPQRGLVEREGLPAADAEPPAFQRGPSSTKGAQ